MRTIFRKLLFLFVLFVMPFVSSNAFAECKRIVFGYAPIASDTTNVVEIVRYYNDSANTWFVDAGCSGTGTRTVEIPLRGVFDQIPVVFKSSGSGYSYVNGIIPLERTVVASGTIECSRNVPDVLTCGLGRSSEAKEIVEGHYSPAYYYNNVYTSGTSSCRITTFSYETGSLVHECLAAGVCTSFHVYGTDRTTPLKTFYYDSNVGLYYYADSACSQFLGSFDVSANTGLNQTASPLPITFNAGPYGSPTSYNVLEVGSTSVTDSRGAGIYCNYDQATDYLNSVATATCQFNYNVSSSSEYWVSAVLAPAAISTGTVSVYRNAEDGLSYVKATLSAPCYTLSVNLGLNVVDMYYDSGNNVWRDGSCTGEAITADGKRVPVSASENNIPVSFSTTSGSVTQATIGNSYDNTTNVHVLYDAHKNSGAFTLIPTGTITANTTLYPTYAVRSSNAESLVMTYSNQKQHLKNYFQIKIMENDSMPETIFYHDESGYYDSNYSSISGDSFSVSLNDTVAKVPVIFQYTEVESPVTKEVSNWGGVSSLLYCDYDSAQSQQTMNCRLPSLNYIENRAYYVSSYAKLDSRKLKIVGGGYSLTAYCNPLVLNSGYTQTKTYYSQYYYDASSSKYLIRWYSDDACTTELTQNLVGEDNYPFRLPLVGNAGVYAVPFLFDTTGTSFLPVDDNYTTMNSGPIFCVYNSAENSADCKFNWVDGYGSAGVLGAPVSTLNYFGVGVAKVLDGKILQISNTSKTTVIEYSIPEFCSKVTLSIIDGTETIYYTDGEGWFADASCTNQQNLVLPDAPEGTVILYFRTKCLLEPNKVVESGDITYTVSTDVPCTYSSGTDVTCDFDMSEITTDTEYCASDFAMKCVSNPSAGCELEVTNDGNGSISVDYSNYCKPGYHD